MTLSLYFTKACALGNDFVIVEAEAFNKTLDITNLSVLLANRRRGIGCDQVIYIYPTEYKDTYKIRFFNADGSEAESCGNGSRCVAKLLMQTLDRQEIILQTLGGKLKCHFLENGHVSVAYPKPSFKQGISLNPHLFVSSPEVMYVDIGNPHLVCFVEDIMSFEKWGPLLETHLYEIDPQHPERVNVGFVQVLDDKTLHLNVWERGVGHTHACGTGACAAAFAANIYGLVGETVQVNQYGGPLTIALGNEELFLQGEGNMTYTGEFFIK